MRIGQVDVALFDQPETTLLADLEAAADELRAALDGVTLAQSALQVLPKEDTPERVAELEVVWQQLNQLGRPIVTVRACSALWERLEPKLE